MAETSTKKSDDILKKMRENILNRMNSKNNKGNIMKKSASSPAFLKQLSRTREVVIKLGEDSTSSEGESSIEKNIEEVQNPEAPIAEKRCKTLSKKAKQKLAQDNSLQNSNNEKQAQYKVKTINSKNDEKESINIICKEVLDEIIEKVTNGKPRTRTKKVPKLTSKTSRPNLKLSKVLEKKLEAVEGEWKKQKLLRLKYKIIEERFVFIFGQNFT